MEIIWFIIVGMIAGWLAGQFMRGAGFGIIGNLLVGVVGAVLGGMLFGAVGVEGYGLLGSIVVATIGAMILLAISAALRPGSRHR